MENAAIVTTVHALLNTYTREIFTAECHRFVEVECGMPVGAANDRSWNDCYDFLVEYLPKDKKYGDFHLVFEYMMPESMKRADVLLLTKEQVIVLEFKQKREIKKDDISQAAGYAQSIHNYHYITSKRNMVVKPYMVYTLGVSEGRKDIVPVLQASNFEQELIKILDNQEAMTHEECDEWIMSPFYPLKNLADATLQLFRDGELPNIKTIREGDIQETLNAINSVIDDNRYAKSIIFVTGVPGAGKTLVGLKTVYDHAISGMALNPIYLSGNDPLVDILQKTLSANHIDRDGESYIQPMKNFKRLAYGDRVPLNNIIVFDEAQRAWDTDRQRPGETEATLLLKIADRIAERHGKVTLICLIGEGQAIHLNEETGMPIWSAALNGRNDWNTFIPEKFQDLFSSVPNCIVKPELFLNTSIRNDFIDVSPWVEAILKLDLAEAKRLYQEMIKQGFGCWYFTKKEKIQPCIEFIMRNHPGSHTGLVVSSHFDRFSRNLFGPQYRGSYVRANEAYQWYTKESYTLTRAASEFLIQGIELEYPIVTFVGDYYINNGEWTIDPNTTDPGLNDLRTVIENVYRVLLTRSRKGMYLYIPDIPKMKETIIWFKSLLSIDE